MQTHSGYQRACIFQRCTSRDEPINILAKEGNPDTPLPENDIIAHKIFNLNASGRQDWFPSLAIFHGSTTAFIRSEPQVVPLQPTADFFKSSCFIFQIDKRCLVTESGCLARDSSVLRWQHDWSTVLETDCCRIVHTVLFCRLSMSIKVAPHTAQMSLGMT